MTKIFSFLFFFVSSIALAENHYDANNCEIFIDKAIIFKGSHGGVGVTFWVKTLNDRLDGEVEEVGFRKRSYNFYKGEWQPQHLWDNQKLEKSFGANYWNISLGLGNNYGSTRWEGRFYVKTKNGTYYWARPRETENFFFDRLTADYIFKLAGNRWSYPSDLSQALPTQLDGMRYYNPNRCY